MGRQHKRNPVIQLCQDAAQMRVPGMNMDNAGVDRVRIEIKTALNGVEDNPEFFRRLGRTGRRVVSRHGERFRSQFLTAKTADVDVAKPRKFTAKVINMNPRPSVNMRRIFIRQEHDFHVFFRHKQSLIGVFKNKIEPPDSDHDTTPSPPFGKTKYPDFSEFF